MGYPVLGDKLYGVKRQKALVTLPALKKALAKLPRHVLHAAQLGFEHPRTKQQMSFQTEWPEDLDPLINELEKIK
jgi:23S rRNA pseudouridine1911/1915/1917 synthase